jgi:lysophospholipase L1-like esterase
MALVAVMACPPLRAATAGQSLQPGDLVAVCGDSITEQRLYSVFMEDYLLMCQPAAQVQAMQFGWGGETSWGFRDRMANDVLVFKPSVATTCYGMNDGGYAALTADRSKQYREATETIIKSFRQAGVRFIVVGSPGVVDSNTFRRGAAVYNETLGQLRDIAHEVATQQGVTFADVHSPMLAAMEKAKAKYGTAYAVAGPDGVHPGANGHLIMAYAFLKALGCSGDIGTITLNATTGKATATEGHKVLKSSATSVEIESSRYPFCFSGEPNSPNGTTGIIEFFPFNEDLNRLRLVVQDGPSGKVKVTWGSHSKIFSSEDLQKGINLAAEFLDNPFSEPNGPFAKVEALIKAQQAYETPAIKTLLHSLPQWDKSLPESKTTLDRLREDLANKDVNLRKAARAAVVPVRHTIKIEAASGQ